MEKEQSGKVYVGKKAPRGVSGERDPRLPDVVNINATSGSMNKIDGESAKQFSPMYLGPVVEYDIFGKGDQTARCFENYWQYGKMFMELGHIAADGTPTEKWYDFREYGYAKEKGDRHPRGTKSNNVKHIDHRGRRNFHYYAATSSYYLDQQMDYITSRKLIYAPVYAHLVKRTPAFTALQEQIRLGKNVMILDLDVPPGAHEVTLAYLRQRINDSDIHFGHGNVLAGLLAGIEPEQYC